MRTPGVYVRPLREITGSADFNEVFLDSVRIPVDRVIGEVNNGWRIANSSLAHERSGVAAGSVELVAQLENLFEPADGEARQAARDRLGRLATHVREIGRASCRERGVSTCRSRVSQYDEINQSSHDSSRAKSKT